jgi:hypothetical protein
MIKKSAVTREIRFEISNNAAAAHLFFPCPVCAKPVYITNKNYPNKQIDTHGIPTNIMHAHPTYRMGLYSGLECGEGLRRHGRQTDGRTDGHLHNLFHHGNALFPFESLSEHGTSLTISSIEMSLSHLFIVRLTNTRRRQLALEHELNSHAAWDTNETSHGRRSTVAVTVGFERRSDSLLFTIRANDFESVLEQDNVNFTVGELTCLFETRGEGAHDGSSRNNGLGREEAELTELGNDNLGNVSLGKGVEASQLVDDRTEISELPEPGCILFIGLNAEHLGGKLAP